MCFSLLGESRFFGFAIARETDKKIDCVTCAQELELASLGVSLKLEGGRVFVHSCLEGGPASQVKVRIDYMHMHMRACFLPQGLLPHWCRA